MTPAPPAPALSLAEAEAEAAVSSGGRWSDRRRLTVANVVSQGLLGLSVLVVTRLYEPEVFALFVAVDAVLQVVANVPAAGLERGLARASSPGSYVQILRTSLVVAVASPVLLIAPIALNVARTADVDARQVGELVLAGLALASTRGVLFILRYHGVVSGQLGLVIRLELVGAALLLVARSGFGLLVGTAQALLLAATAAGLSTVVVVARGLRLEPDPGADLAQASADVDVERPVRTVAVERPVRTVAVEGPIAVLQRIPTHGLAIIVALVVDAETVGLLALAALLTFRPVSVAARATADLALASLAARRRSGSGATDRGPGRDLADAVRVTTILSVALLITISVAASLGAESAFGPAWGGVAAMTWALLPLNVATIVVIPVQHALTVAGRGRLRLVAAAVMAAAVGASVGFGHLVGLGIHTALVVAGAAALVIVGALVRLAGSAEPAGLADRPGSRRW